MVVRTPRPFPARPPLPLGEGRGEGLAYEQPTPTLAVTTGDGGRQPGVGYQTGARGDADDTQLPTLALAPSPTSKHS